MTSGGTPGSLSAIPRHAPIPAEITMKNANENTNCFHNGLLSTSSSSV
eukprot:CAMPEP_0119039108 /NCGR_PEP_ID=MMETSP1177-20130426/8433_1 /TAXON_ID=2985 /ORGANISM="Ochromonas sp, Strain CCMP1899" /LENGTH=47 /DNA_ID= /DNA_START= /DNA_END= /DNA_ORIENTATION=